MASLSVLSVSQQETKGLIPTASNQGSVQKGGGGENPAGTAVPGSLLLSQVRRGKGSRSAQISGTQSPVEQADSGSWTVCRKQWNQCPPSLSPML